MKEQEERCEPGLLARLIGRSARTFIVAGRRGMLKNDWQALPVSVPYFRTALSR